MLTAVRGQLVMLQGIWFIQIAEILFKGEGLARSLLLCGESLMFKSNKCRMFRRKLQTCPQLSLCAYQCSVWAEFVCVSCGVSM